MVTRLKAEMEMERQNFLQKRKQERDYLQRMMAANDEAKRDLAKRKEIEKMEDWKAQEQYLHMLEVQEKDRENDFKQRENRTQQYLNQVSDMVLTKMEERRKLEEDNLRRYELEKEMRDRLEDERRARKQREQQDEMRHFLATQVNEKKARQ